MSSFILMSFSLIDLLLLWLLFIMCMFIIRDWSLITWRGATQREGGREKFYPYKKRGGGWRKSFSYAEGGAQQV